LWLLLAVLDFGQPDHLMFGCALSLGVFLGMRGGECYMANWEDFGLDALGEGLTWRPPFSKTDQDGQSVARGFKHSPNCVHDPAAMVDNFEPKTFCAVCMFQRLWEALGKPRSGPVFAEPGGRVMKPQQLNAALRHVVDMATSGRHPLMKHMEDVVKNGMAEAWEKKECYAMSEAFARLSDLSVAAGGPVILPPGGEGGSSGGRFRDRYTFHGGRRGGTQCLSQIPGITVEMLMHWGRWKCLDSLGIYLGGNREELHSAAMAGGMMHCIYQAQYAAEKGPAQVEETLRLVRQLDAGRGIQAIAPRLVAAARHDGDGGASEANAVYDCIKWAVRDALLEVQSTVSVASTSCCAVVY
jgi:hypothetical protein